MSHGIEAVASVRFFVLSRGGQTVDHLALRTNARRSALRRQQTHAGQRVLNDDGAGGNAKNGDGTPARQQPDDKQTDAIQKQRSVRLCYPRVPRGPSTRLGRAAGARVAQRRVRPATRPFHRGSAQSPATTHKRLLTHAHALNNTSTVNRHAPTLVQQKQKRSCANGQVRRHARTRGDILIAR